MQTCFFALAGVIPKDEAIALIKKTITKTYAKKGQHVVDKNFEAVDSTLANLYAVSLPNTLDGKPDKIGYIDPKASEFVKQVTAKMMSGKGDLFHYYHLMAHIQVQRHNGKNAMLLGLFLNGKKSCA